MQNDRNPHAETVGFIGLGEMGLPMAGHLARAGTVVAYDASDERRPKAAEAGVAWASSAAGVATASTGTVIVMVRTLAQVEEVLFGAQGCVSADERRDIVIMSTVHPDAVRAIGERVAEYGSTVVDAPVSGGSKGAEAATLAIMASGSDDALDRVAPVLSRLGHLTVVGPHAGQGQAVKLANQVMMAAAMAGTVEGLQVAARHGVGEARVRDVVGRGTGASWVLENWEWMSRLWEEYEPGNALDVLHKDMRALLDVSAADWVPLPVTAAAFQRLLAHWASHGAVKRTSS